MARWNPETLMNVHEAAIKAGLADCRSALLAGIRADFIASLPCALTPAAQLLSDLHALADAETLADGSVPLAIWWLNARILAGQRPEADYFGRDCIDFLAEPSEHVLAV